jgi:hypothetical protein
MDGNIISTLWDEKNLIEPQKNLENKRELETFDITKNAEPKYEKVGCINTGNSKRKCWSKGQIHTTLKGRCLPGSNAYA